MEGEGAGHDAVGDYGLYPEVSIIAFSFFDQSYPSIQKESIVRLNKRRLEQRKGRGEGEIP